MTTPSAKHRGRLPLFSACLFAALVSTSGCGPTTAGQDGGLPTDGGVKKDSGGVSYTDVQKTVFSASCGGFPTCHLDPKRPFGGGLDLTEGHSYAHLVNIPAAIAPTKKLVEPGNVDDSFLWQKLTNRIDGAPTGGPEGNPMPFKEAGNWTLPPANQLNLVRAWIAEGAPNN